MANGLLSKQEPDAFAGLLYSDPSVNYRGMLAPFLKRTVTDPIDDVSEYEQTEFAMPSLLYDPLKGLVGMGQMLRGERPVDPREITKTALDIGMLSAPVGFLGGVPKGAVLGANVGGRKTPTDTSSGLLDDTACRMQRAQDMGFDVDAYHGTDAAVTEFIPLAKGQSTKAKSAKKAYWFSDNPETASGYADAATDSKVQSLIDQSYAAERKGNFDSAEKLMADAETLEQGTNLRGQNIIPAKLRGKLKMVDMEGAKYDPDDISLSKILTDAEFEGFEGVAFKNFSDEAGYGQYNPTTHYAVFDPKNIRSRFAKFDPDKADSADLLAANPPTAGILGLLSQQNNEN